MNLSPVVLFVYNRLWHTRLTVEALKRNEFARQSDLIIYSDGHKRPADQPRIDEVRGYVRSIKGFNSIKIIERSKNLGLAKSIIAGVSEVVSKYGQVIVLEDDMVTSPFFLRYMNEALELYEHQEKVISIHGYIYPVKEKLPETFFLRGADCWGWATWKRGWNLFEENGRKLLDELQAKKLTGLFDFNGAFGYTKMLKDQIAGRNNSWAVRWYASAFLHNRLTLYPGTTLVNNVGIDGTGTHCGIANTFDAKPADEPIPVRLINITENIEARKIVEDYFRFLRAPSVKRIVNFGRSFVANMLKQ